MGTLIGLGLAFTVHAQAPTSKNLISGTESNDNPYIQADVIYKPNPPSEPKITVDQRTTGTNIRNQAPISVAAIRQYLESKGSPLAAYSDQIAASPYSGTILGICTIEQYGCSKAPNSSPYNFWGIMGRNGLAKYENYAVGITAINDWLASHEANHPTIESLNGYYVQPASTAWLSTVLKIKKQLEAN